MGKVLINNTNGKENLERATLSFVVANAALSSDQEAIILLTIDGAWVATKGYSEGLQAEGFAPLTELVAKFVAGGGSLWVCGACAKPRGITAEHLVEGAQLVGAAKAVEEMVNGAQTLSF
ncbi:MAG: DsrE family protein [Chloroflexota bacterium]